MVDLSLIRGAAAVPEEHPLQGLVALQLVLEPKHVVLVEELDQVQDLRRGFDHRERGRLRVVHERGDPSVRVEPEEPFLLLLVGHDVDQRRAPFRAVNVVELLEDDLRRLAVGRVLRDEVQALGGRHFLGRFGDVEV